MNKKPTYYTFCMDFLRLQEKSNQTHISANNQQFFTRKP